MSDWISVKDRLPKGYAKCWVNYRSGWIEFQREATFDGHWYVNGNRADEYITHWMPLPEPPGISTDVSIA